MATPIWGLPALPPSHPLRSFLFNVKTHGMGGGGGGRCVLRTCFKPDGRGSFAP